MKKCIPFLALVLYLTLSFAPLALCWHIAANPQTYMPVWKLMTYDMFVVRLVTVLGILSLVWLYCKLMFVLIVTSATKKDVKHPYLGDAAPTFEPGYATFRVDETLVIRKHAPVFADWTPLQGHIVQRYGATNGAKVGHVGGGGWDNAVTLQMNLDE